MVAAGKYLKKQFQLSMFKLEHHSVSDFYLSCWQKNRAVFPLLCVRAIIFLGCLAILLSSAVVMGQYANFGYWFIFMTHWGLLMITLTSGFAFAVSCRAYRMGPIEASFELPWFVKTYWVLYITTVPIAFYITIFYYVFLTGAMEELEVNAVLDVFTHAINSVLMLTLVMTSRQPARLLHFIYPFCFAFLYMLFSVIYYFAGGISPFGDTHYIYPMLDWSEGAITFGISMISGVGIIVIHLVVVGITAIRNALTRSYRRDSMPVSNIPYK